jgi:hypothetical protein
VGGSKAITVHGAIMNFFASYVAISIASDMEIYELVFLSMCISLMKCSGIDFSALCRGVLIGNHQHDDTFHALLE